jgi:acetylornithine deacetylase
MALSDAERSVCTAIEQERDRLVALTTDLIAFDTTAREVGDPPRSEAALQECLAARLQAIGAETDLFEPDPAALVGRPLVPQGLDFAGRPQLIARRRGGGGGRSLIFHGHIDAVSAEPRGAWSSDPFAAVIRDGKLYGRGACDMKGGIAAMVTAAEALAELGIELDGDLLVATNTDEESTGAGGTTLVDRGLAANAAIVPEATDFRVWVACRGTDYALIRVPGRPGHAEVRQPPWRTGGAVNAIDRATVVLDAIRTLREEWCGATASTICCCRGRRCCRRWPAPVNGA